MVIYVIVSLKGFFLGIFKDIPRDMKANNFRITFCRRKKLDLDSDYNNKKKFIWFWYLKKVSTNEVFLKQAISVRWV